MNLEVRVFFNYAGPAPELEPLLSDLTDVMLAHGYGTEWETDALNSLIVLRESDVTNYDHPEDFVKSVMKNTLSIIVPTKEEANERSGD